MSAFEPYQAPCNNGLPASNHHRQTKTGYPCLTENWQRKPVTPKQKQEPKYQNYDFKS